MCSHHFICPFLCWCYYTSRNNQFERTVFSPSGKSFKKALLIQYPRKGLWTIAFQTSDYQGEIAQKIGKELVNISRRRFVQPQILTV
jgi:uncharacterized membrane protein